MVPVCQPEHVTAYLKKACKNIPRHSCILRRIMSELQRSFAKAKLSGLPFEPPLPPNQLKEDEEDEEDEEDDDERDGLKPLPEPTPDDDSSSASSASSASSTGTIRPSPSKQLFARPKGFV